MQFVSLKKYVTNVQKQQGQLVPLQIGKEPALGSKTVSCVFF
jgi:hypothetical protein